jgi:hypothetical protein
MPVAAIDGEPHSQRGRTATICYNIWYLHVNFHLVHNCRDGPPRHTKTAAPPRRSPLRAGPHVSAAATGGGGLAMACAQKRNAFCATPRCSAFVPMQHLQPPPPPSPHPTPPRGSAQAAWPAECVPRCSTAHRAPAILTHSPCQQSGRRIDGPLAEPSAPPSSAACLGKNSSAARRQLMQPRAAWPAWRPWQGPSPRAPA